MTTPIQNPYTRGQSSEGDQAGNLTTIASTVRVGQIITFALVQGVIVVAAVMTYLAFGNREVDQQLADAQDAADFFAMPSSADDWLLPALGIAVAVGAAVVALVVPNLMRRSGIIDFRATGTSLDVPVDPKQSLPWPASKLMGTYLTSKIVGEAVLEGAAMLNLVLLMLDQSVLHYVPIAALLAGIALQFPTISKAQHFLELAQR